MIKLVLWVLALCLEPLLVVFALRCLGVDISYTLWTFIGAAVLLALLVHRDTTRSGYDRR